MQDFTHPLIFDGHNDVLGKLYMKKSARPHREFLDGYEAHIDVPKAKAGGFAGGFFAIYIPSPPDTYKGFEKETRGATYDVPLPPALKQSEALPVALAQAAILKRLEAEGALKICTSVEEIHNCMQEGIMAAIMHMEGAEAIDENFDVLEVFYAAGLRSLGPVWSRPTSFGHGVPFRFPSDGDTGPGLTDLGKELVRHCNRLKILLDMSHLNEAGFWDVAKISDAPLVATHSNTNIICPSARNLTDKQLGAIRDSDGIVGINFAVGFLRKDGQWNTDISLDIIMDHLDHLISHVGEDRIGFGSDFDGAEPPNEIDTCAKLPNLRAALKQHGVNDALMKKLCHDNWLGVLKRTWGE
jgi:membrane dipeptidase